MNKMSNILCEWTTCKYNSAPTWTTEKGYCMCNNDLYMKHVDNEDTAPSEDDIIEGLKCRNYKQDNTKPVK